MTILSLLPFAIVIKNWAGGMLMVVVSEELHEVQFEDEKNPSGFFEVLVYWS